MREFDAADEDIVRLLRDTTMEPAEAIERVSAIMPLGLSLQDVADALALRRFRNTLPEHWMWMASSTARGRDGPYFLVHAADGRTTDTGAAVKGTGMSLAEAADACREALVESLAKG